MQAAAAGRSVDQPKFNLKIENTTGERIVEVESLGDLSLPEIASADVPVTIAGSVVHEAATTDHNESLLKALGELGVNAASAANVNLSA